MTKNELREQIQLAYDHYLDVLDELAHEFTIVPGSPRQLENDTRTRDDAAIALAEFNATQNRLNNEFALSVNKPYLEEEARKALAAKIHNAECQVDAAQTLVDEYEQAQENARKYGYEPDELSIKALADAKQKLTEAEENLELVKREL